MSPDPDGEDSSRDRSFQERLAATLRKYQGERRRSVRAAWTAVVGRRGSQRQYDNVAARRLRSIMQGLATTTGHSKLVPVPLLISVHLGVPTLLFAIFFLYPADFNVPLRH